MVLFFNKGEGAKCYFLTKVRGLSFSKVGKTECDLKKIQMRLL
jgi:hypothetical protein